MTINWLLRSFAWLVLVSAAWLIGCANPSSAETGDTLSDDTEIDLNEDETDNTSGDQQDLVDDAGGDDTADDTDAEDDGAADDSTGDGDQTADDAAGSDDTGGDSTDGDSGDDDTGGDDGTTDGDSTDGDAVDGDSAGGDTGGDDGTTAGDDDGTTGGDDDGTTGGDDATDGDSSTDDFDAGLVPNGAIDDDVSSWIPGNTRVELALDADPYQGAGAGAATFTGTSTTVKYYFESGDIPIDPSATYQWALSLSTPDSSQFQDFKVSLYTFKADGSYHYNYSLSEDSPGPEWIQLTGQFGPLSDEIAVARLRVQLVRADDGDDVDPVVRFDAASVMELP